MSSVDEILEQLRAIVDAAEGRDLTEEEAERYEKLEAQLHSARRTEQIKARQRAYDTPVSNKAIEAAVHVAPAKKDDGLEKAFDHYLRTGKENADIQELRNAQSSGTPSEGGYLVPDGFRQKLVDRMKAFGGLANVVEEITTETGQPLPWVTVDDTSNTGEIVAENGTFAGGADLTFGTASLGAYSYMAGGGSAQPLRVPLELVQDSAFDLQGLVSRKLGERIARIQAHHLVNGTGSGEPQGIIDGLTPVEILDDTKGIQYSDLVNIIHSVDPAYRTNARWAFNDKTLGLIRKLLDQDGRPLLQPAGQASAAGSPGGETLLGYPVTIDQAFPDADLDNDEVLFGVFGDLREGYVVRRVRAIEILVNPYSRMANRQIEYTAWARMDAVQQNTHAYVAFSGEDGA